jgi:hypothetical protein
MAGTVRLGNPAVVPAPTAAGHAVPVGSGLRFDNQYMPMAFAGSVVVDPATGAQTLDPSTANNKNFVMTGDITINEPIAGDDGQVMQITARASGATRVVTIHANIERLDGLPATYSTATGKIFRGALRYSDLAAAGSGGWILEAARVTL